MAKKVRCKNCLKKKPKEDFGVNSRGNKSKVCSVCKTSIKKKNKQYESFCKKHYGKKKRKYKKKDTKESKLYLIRCYSNGEDFLKLGMTTKKVSERFKNNIPYKYEIIGVMPVEINIMLDYEQALHSLFKKYKYYPILEFSGYTECYTLEAKSEIIKFFK